ncbi:MAG: hypothetical protein WCJ11_09135 [Methylococcaceae bacterium]
MKKSKVRYLTAALVATSFLSSSAPSYALGIGEMKLQSALNQSLKAEIALILSEGEQANDFKVGLAPNAKFDELGIPWTVFLSKIKFGTVIKDGKTLIELNSTDVLKEPFLDFLLEIKSVKGTLYREFTVLVDPPEAYQAVKTPQASAPTEFELPLRFISAPVKTKRVARPSAIKPIHTQGKSAIVSNPLAGDTPKETPAKSTPVAAVESTITQQKMVEFEQKLSAMQKIIAEKDAQIATLKLSESENAVNPVATSPVIAPPVLPPAPATSPTTPIPPISPLILTTPTAESVSQPISILPPATLPVITPPKKVPVAVAVNPVKPLAGNYFGISAELYYYIAGGTGLSLLGLMAWLHLRKKSKTVVTKNAPIAESKGEKNDGNQTEMDNEKTQSDSFSMQLGNEDLDMHDAEFEELFGAQFNDMANTNSDARNTNDVLSKADVYLAYGNYEQAEKLLHDEFIEHPDAHDYALRLLKIYISQDNKAKFKDFMLTLIKLGKNELPEFWVPVSDLAVDFYPESLFFVPSTMSDSLASTPFKSTLDNKNSVAQFDGGFDFSSMDFDDLDSLDDENIMPDELFGNEALNKVDNYVFESAVEFEKPTSELEEFIFGEPLKNETTEFEFNDGLTLTKEEPELDFGIFETPIKEPTLDFDMFEMGESFEVDMLEFEKSTEEPRLDFHLFEMSESLETEILEFEKSTQESSLDFGVFEISELLETETLAFEADDMKLKTEPVLLKKITPEK